MTDQPDTENCWADYFNPDPADVQRMYRLSKIVGITAPVRADQGHGDTAPSAHALPDQGVHDIPGQP